MHPAKEVGGDFYDFFLIDQDHCGVVIADVSGKGVPAALFMMRVKALLNQLLREDLSPDQVLVRGQRSRHVRYGVAWGVGFEIRQIGLRQRRAQPAAVPTR